MEDENLYDKIKELFGNIPDNFSILEEEIDIDLQLEYFEFSRKHRNDIEREEILKHKDDVFIPILSSSSKKSLLVQLASIDDVEAYRTIEKYVSKPDTGLRDWAVLAFQESRMLLESKLLDENQVFISTGLGGKENKLRYFIVIMTKKNADFTDFQKDIVYKEFTYILQNYNAVIEEINFFRNFATMVALIPIELALKVVFKDAIKECNQYGDFLNSHFIITNVKKLSKREILEFLNDHKKQKQLKSIENKDETYDTDDFD